MSAVVAPVSETDGAPVAPAVSAGFRRYALVLLMLIYTINCLDRQIVTILAEPIKNELGLHDWQIGVMTGLAFALLYTILGLPIARIAERGDRPMIIGTAIAVWSGFTVVCGLAQNFIQLILARVGVGVGEAGCTPPAMSLIADYTPAAQRASAMAFYTLGSPLGALLGMSVGGLIAAAFGWRMAFIVVGAPGLLLAVVALATLKEPRRRLRAEMRARASEAPTFRDALREVGTKRAFWFIIFAASVKSFMSYGMSAFTASFFLRVHAQELAEVAQRFGLQSIGFLGLVLGLAAGAMGLAGAMIGGLIADRYGAKDKRAWVSIPAVAAVIATPFYFVALTTESFLMAVALLAFPGLLNSLWFGPTYAALQSMVRPQTRATAVALLLFVSNLLGLGMGPLAVGFTSDFLAHNVGLGPAEGVRWALMIFVGVGLLGSVLFWLARRTIRDEIVS